MSGGDIFGSSFEEFERQAAKLLGRVTRSAERAEQFENEVRKGTASRSTLESRVRQEVARDRIRGETVGQRAPATGKEAAAAERELTAAANETAAALEREAVAQEQVNKARTRARTIPVPAGYGQSVRQYGQYAGSIARERELTQRYGPYAGGKALEREMAEFERYSNKVAANLQRQFAYSGLPGVPAAGPGRPYGLGVGAPMTPATAAYRMPRGEDWGGLGDEAKKLEEARQQASYFRSEMGRVIQTQASASQAMRRHGALTTEFIQEAARGTVTLRELGFQVGATIGKFGGWLVAGTAVYGVVGAMGALYRGAVDADAGVAKLNTVITSGFNPDQAIQKMQALSEEFNLPIDDVANAAYQMGKVFHDQNAAFDASRSVLYAVKVGELDVTTATRYLIATVNGGNLSVAGLTAVMNELNQVQQKMGVSIPDTAAGVAKATGTFIQSGGHVRNLVALIAAAQKVTGQTGEVIGTAIARAPNFLRQASNQAVLREFGVTAGTNTEKAIEQGMQIAQKLSGKRVQELAAAIFGPQYGARVGTGLISHPEFYKQALDVTSPEKRRGSAAQELQKRLQGADEQLKMILNGFERLGANLVRTHFGDILGVGLETLNQTLTLANRLLEVFDRLPEGVQQAVAYFLEFQLIAGALRRANLGASIAGPPGGPPPTGAKGFAAGFLGYGDRSNAKNIRSGMFREQQFLEDERARITTEWARGQARASAASEVVLSEQRKLTQVAYQSGTQSELYGQQLSRVTAAQEEVNSAYGRITQLRIDDAANVQRQAQVARSLETTQTTLRNRLLHPIRNRPAARDRAAIQEAIRTGDYYPVTGERPTLAAPTSEDETRRLGQEAGRTASGLIVPIKVAQESVEEGLTTAERDARRAESGMGRIRTSGARFGAALSGILGSFGNILFGIFAADLILETLKGISGGLQDRIDKIEEGASSFKSEQRRLKNVRSEAHSGSGVSDYISDFFTQSGAFRNSLIGRLGIGGAGGEGAADQRNDVAKLVLAQQKQIEYNRRVARRRGDPVPFRYANDIDRDIRQIQESGKSRAEIQRRLNQYDDELAKSMEAFLLAGGSSKEQQARLKKAQHDSRVASAANAPTRSLAARISTLPNIDDVTKELEANAGAIAGPLGFDRNFAARAGIVYNEIYTRLSSSTNADDMKKLAEARDTFFSGVQDAVQKELERALLFAHSPADRHRAYAAAYRRIQESLIGNLRDQIQDQTKEIQQTQRQSEAVGNKVIPKRLMDRQRRVDSLGNLAGVLGIQDPIGTWLERNNEAIKGLDAQIKKDKGDLQKMRRELKERKRLRDELERTLKDQEREERLATRDAKVQALQAGTADPLRQAAIAIREAGRDMQDALSRFGRDSKEFWDALSAQRQAMQDRVQAELARYQAQLALSGAGIPSSQPTAQLRDQLSDAQNYLAKLQSYGDKVDPTDVINAEADVRRLQAQLADQVEQDAEDLKNAIYDIAVARAEARGNDVAAARAELRKAEFALRAADTPVERAQARAEIIRQHAAVRDAISQRAIENVDYQAQIHDWTAQHEIAAYKRLLRTLTLTRDQRRDLLLKIKGLQDDLSDSSGFELEVADIKLPTIYDIRRAVQGGINSNPQTNYHDNRTQNIAVNVKGGSQSTVEKALDNVVNGPNRASRRSAGLTP